MKAETLRSELGPRVLHAMHVENTGKPKWRVLAIVLRWYDGFNKRS